ncbi:hypothetical protein SDC9_144946 [bioreactor metagenome]|uniref:FAD:protein FMN transferase n=1 Tax=bioreactor metagenome TaxID=1076179 RepID=A0A645E8M9_9ZZZZ
MRKGKFSWQFAALGTVWQIDIFDQELSLPVSQLQTLILEKIEDFDKNYSRFRPDSLLSQLAMSSGNWQFPENFTALWQLYQQLFELTAGRFTPLIASDLEKIGYRGFRKPEANFSEVSWQDLQWQAPFLENRRPVLLDFGAAGKGYLLDLLAAQLRSFSCQQFCLDAGHDFWFENPQQEQWRVGLEDPQHTQQALGILTYTGQALAASAGNRRRFGNSHHIFDPLRQSSPKDVLATWVLAKTALEADAVSTALFLVEPKVLQEKFQFQFLRVFNDYRIERSADFPVELLWQTSPETNISSTVSGAIL